MHTAAIDIVADPVLRAEGLGRVFPSRAGDVVALDGIDLEVYPGELVVVRGPSGAGKSTLLRLLGGLDSPTTGEIWVHGTSFASLSEDEAALLRRDDLGFIFQSFGLIPVLSAAENVELPLRMTKTDAAARAARVAEVLALVGLSDHAAQRPDELSGGQQQRVGIARALAVPPRILIADEPTAQLDSVNAAVVMDLLASLVDTDGLSVVIATHDPDLAARAHRVIELHDGRQRRPAGRHKAQG
nr:ABC transporter ATP-binding protein [Conyzicola lurida]